MGQQVESQPSPPEVILADFRKHCQLEAGHVYTSPEREVIAHTLHQKLEKLEKVEILHQYEQGVIPTIESLKRAADAAITILTEEADDTEALQHAKLIEGQTNNIRRWCRRYVESLILFHIRKSAFMRMNKTDQRDALEQADRDRRRIHDSLLASLTTFNILLTQTSDLVQFQMPIEWKPGVELPEGTAHEHAVIFSPEAIQNRDLIREWSVIADSVEQLHMVVKRMESSENTETAAP